MIDEKRLIKVSKYLSKHLRHNPERIGLQLQPGGWVEIDELLTAAGDHGFPISHSDLDRVVADNDKQRFRIEGTRIRANQGHSVPVDLGLTPQAPPEVLYHGTGERTVAAIHTDGLRRMGRHHVHLSTDIEAARRVGQRHGRPAIFVVEAARLHRDGHAFFRSDNGVWLVDQVPPEYLRLLPALT